MNKLVFIIFTYKIISVLSDSFSEWFQDQTQEIFDPPLKIDFEFFNGYNELPEILTKNSSLIRLGPTILNTPENKYTNYIDGFGRISKWTFSYNPNEVLFQSTIIKSTLWNNSNDGMSIPPHITSEKIYPSKFNIVQLDNMDNTDVYPYRFETKPNFLTLSTDFYQTNQIDYNNLKTIGSTNFNDEGIDGTFSSSHSAEYYDKINNKIYKVNWLGQKDLTGTKIKLYIMDDTYTRKIIGSYHIKYLPYSIHSIMVIDNYALLYISPVKLKFLASGFNSCISCSYTDNLNSEDSQFIIFDLTSSDQDSKPVSIINIPKSNNFFVFHYSNAKFISNTDNFNNFDNFDNLKKIEVDVCAYNSMEGILGKYVLGNLEDMFNPDIRNNIPYLCDNIKRIRLDIKLNKLDDVLDLPLQDIDGNKYRVELLSINNKYNGIDYCYTYAVSAHIFNSNKYEDMGIVKINLCKAQQILEGTIDKNTPTVEVFTLQNVYFGEPIFVPNQNKNNYLYDKDSEDDGYLLVITRDGNDNKTKLLIIDAKTLTLIASATSPFELMFEFHGKYFVD